MPVPARSSPATALVTGASSGIGREFARIAADDGADVVLVARREAVLAELAAELEADAGISATVLPVDLARPDGAETILEAVQGRGLDVDLLVNNAGLAEWGRFDEIPRAAVRQMIGVNVAALTELTDRFARSMVDRDGGRIVNVASVAGEAPNAGMPVYAATKAYVRCYTLGLAEQLAPSGVTLTVLIPGWTDTPMGREIAAAAGRDVEEWMDPETAARAGYDGAIAGERTVIPGERNRSIVRDLRAERTAAVE